MSRPGSITVNKHIVNSRLLLEDILAGASDVRLFVDEQRKIHHREKEERLHRRVQSTEKVN